MIAVALIVRNVTATSPRSSVAAGRRSSGRLPRYVYGLVLSTIGEVAVGHFEERVVAGLVAVAADREVRLGAGRTRVSHVRSAA